ncbi:hypothetical protein TNCT_523281 [Trichonephila clavata]|uniref:Uncharacterized protein n=1 Tax=Trichonephila clavata TaxID=2740835 RepID=A0A8X6LSB3_TRICU|nr:hypothetical protein TNCT_523281 [Trichonephila clavata]
MVTTDSCTSSSSSRSHRSIDVNMGPEVTLIPALKSFSSNGPDLGRGHHTHINSLVKFKIYMEVNELKKTQRHSHHIHFSNKV